MTHFWLHRSATVCSSPFLSFSTKLYFPASRALFFRVFCGQCQASLCFVFIVKYDLFHPSVLLLQYPGDFLLCPHLLCQPHYLLSCIRIICDTFCASSLVDCVGVSISYICKRIFDCSNDTLSDCSVASSVASVFTKLYFPACWHSSCLAVGFSC